MLVSGSGELRGISIIEKPASTSASATPSISSGRTPRRIATSGQRAMAAANSGLWRIGPSPDCSDAGDEGGLAVDGDRPAAGGLDRRRIKVAKLRAGEDID